jgi:hypothetical protein
MKIAFRIGSAAVLAVLAVWLWTVLCPSPEKVIRQRFADLARTASVSADAGDLARLSAARSLAGFFATNVEMNLDLPRVGRLSSMDREEITQMYLAASSRGGGMQVKFPDLNVTVAPDSLSAVVDLTVTATIAGEADAIVQEMKVTLHKIDGQWLITRVETVRTLS